MIAAKEAIQNSTLSPKQLEAAGIIWGSAAGGALGYCANQVIEHYKNKAFNLSSYFLSNAIVSAAPANIAIENKIYGINYTASSACASSSQAILNAYEEISSGKLDVIISGGAEAPISEVGFKSFEALLILSKNNENPKEACRPFDYKRDCMVLGEGVAVLVLESLDHAKTRGAEIICEILGGASMFDAFHLLAPDPKGIMMTETINSAMKSSRINKENIDLINLHGTATIRGDKAELTAISNTFGENLEKINFSAIKSLTGHTLGASGAISSIAAALSIKNNFVPSSINFSKCDESFSKINFNLKDPKKNNEIKVVLVNSFGFGGHNVALVFKKFES